ncbi:MAG: hypothetical protein AAGG11_06075 [Pseudomonadota bacterium]
MSEQFKLVFRGEIEDDQHQAVVRKRLGSLLKADDKTLAALFSGQAVVLRKAIDAAGAAKFQDAFKKAGARLRVIPHAALNAGDPTSPVEPQPAPAPRKLTLAERLKASEAAQEQAESPDSKPASMPPSTAPAAAADEGTLRLYPVGADLLEVDEQLPPVMRKVDVSHLTVAEVGERIGPIVEMMADTERFLKAAAAFELAEAGADMAPRQKEADQPLVAPELDLAPTGAALLEGTAAAPTPSVRAPALELAEPGATLVQPTPPSQAPKPDTTHLELVDEPTQD